MNDFQEILFSSEQINNKVDKIASQINNDYKDTKELVLVIILKGATLFGSDLIRKLNIPVRMEFMSLSSYNNSSESSVCFEIRNYFF